MKETTWMLRIVVVGQRALVCTITLLSLVTFVTYYCCCVYTMLKGVVLLSCWRVAEFYKNQQHQTPEAIHELVQVCFRRSFC